MKKTLVILSTILIGAAIVGCSSMKYKNKNKVDENPALTDGQKEISDGKKEISLEDAKAIALANAGLTEDQVIFGDVSKEIDDGISKYEVEFYSDNKEYDYEIDTKTGDIISSTIDK